ncbi:hypothetical protein GCK72_000764 [Caenorhabditis remanei]|uniref:Tc1-like transposase DDE domain-containing protein n=1 Tax=Caenorhabditis remanei TaxID=31234 RepID=A0A6A5HNZ9_CAERE|nr:hypothetical protein GCK72_000764 [Caenorhabditis remanei]KAF1768951.1 hypothetical protein GCK72_000764 [Caenorhabditis remanei]
MSVQEMKNFEMTTRKQSINAKFFGRSLPGFRAASDKGVRVAVAVLTKSGIIHESIDVVTSKRPVSEQLVDYHKNMNAHSYQQYMERVLPAIAAAAPPGRQPVLIPVSTSTNPVIAEFFESQGIAVDPKSTQAELWGEAERFMRANDGSVVMKKYAVDEIAKEYGVIIIRLPPYHCSLNPIELVRQRAIDFLKNVFEATAANIIAHAIDVESDLRVIMEAASRDGDSDDSDYETLLWY